MKYSNKNKVLYPQLDVDSYSHKEHINAKLLEAYTIREQKLIETRSNSVNKLILQITSSSIAFLAALALFVIPVSDSVKSHAKDILFFLCGSATGYAVSSKKTSSQANNPG